MSCRDVLYNNSSVKMTINKLTFHALNVLKLQIRTQSLGFSKKVKIYR